MDRRTGRSPSIRPPVAQGFGTIGQQVAERHEALASSRRATAFPVLWRTKRTKKTKSWVKGGADQDLAGRRVYSRPAERYWIVRSGDDELRFTHRSGAESWANRLAERGLASELTWHDENDASATQADRSVA
jgi:hypothetical protein